MGHVGLQSGRWEKMTLAEQLANVGSEYGRAKKWKEKGNEKMFWGAMDRMLELIDLSINDKRWRGCRLKELVRLRELVCDELLDESSAMTDFSDYFMRYNLLARKV
ncbi:hypothetical protein KJ855_01010 [Patescibacteria group bacterium]|nr:hypothetical protein [Patescibacteria group bacterium]